jgi:hypothetical protein
MRANGVNNRSDFGWKTFQAGEIHIQERSPTNAGADKDEIDLDAPRCSSGVFCTRTWRRD